MRRIPAILLVLASLALGSGALEWVHNCAHAREDAHRAAEATAAAGQDPAPADHPDHDESTCRLHALLNAPQLPTAGPALLVCGGLFVALLTPNAPRIEARRTPLRLDCRGPPAR